MAQESSQDIHLDSFVPGWSFLTAQEHIQELLILWNGYKLVNFINSISGDREAQRQVMCAPRCSALACMV